MRRLALLGLCIPWSALATEQQQEVWLVKTDLWGNTAYQTLTLHREGEAVKGVFDGDTLVGTRRGDILELTVTDAHKAIHRPRPT